MKKLTTYLSVFILFASAVLFLGSDSATDYKVSVDSGLLQQGVLISVTVSNLDSLETRSPSWSEGEFFDASLFNNPDDSVLVSLQQTAAATTDSGLYLLLGTFNGTTTPAVIDTISSNGLTLIQRRLVVTEAGKYTYPFWGVRCIMSDGTAGTTRFYFMNFPKQQRVVVDTTL